MRDVQSNTVFILELEKEVMPGQKITIESLLKDKEEIKSSTVELITAQEAHDLMSKDLPEIQYMSDNPFRDIILFKVKETSFENRDRLIEELEGVRGVGAVFYDQNLLDQLPNSLEMIRIGFLAISIAVLFGCILALILRIKRDLRARKEEIRIMSLAGAQEGHIMDIRRSWSIKWGMITAFFAAIITAINILLMNKTLLRDLEITFLHGVLTILAMIVVVTLIHAATTHITVNKYLAQLNPNIKS